jgi:Domain of unknown function (DUF4260)
MATIQPEPCVGTTPRADSARRGLYLTMGAGLTAFAIIEMIRFGGATWFALAFLLLPDVALVYGAAPNLARGQLHPRAVRFYNGVHSFFIPVALMIIGLWLPPVVFVAGVAWAAHIAWDRGLGYGLRTREGFQRRPVCRS